MGDGGTGRGDFDWDGYWWGVGWFTLAVMSATGFGVWMGWLH